MPAGGRRVRASAARSRARCWRRSRSGRRRSTADDALQVARRARCTRATDGRPGRCTSTVRATSRRRDAARHGCGARRIESASATACRTTGASRRRSSRARASRCCSSASARGGADDARAIRRFASARHVPAMVTYKAKGVVPDDAPVVRRRLHERARSSSRSSTRAICSSASVSIPSSCCRARGRVEQPDRLLRPVARGRRARAVRGAARRPTSPTALDEIERALPPSAWDSPTRPRASRRAAPQVVVPGGGLTAQRVVADRRRAARRRAAA